MPETIHPRATVPCTFPRNPDDPREIDVETLLARCQVLTASSEIAGYRTTLVLKHRATGTVINVRTYTEEGYTWASVTPEAPHVDGEETEESETVYAFENAVLRAEDAAATAATGALVTAARRVLAASAADIFVDLKICPERADDMGEMSAALGGLERALDASASTS